MSFKSSSSLRFKGGDVVVRISDRPPDHFLLHSNALRQHVPWFRCLLSEDWHSRSTMVQVEDQQRPVWQLEMFFDKSLSMGLLHQKGSSLDRSFEPPLDSHDHRDLAICTDVAKQSQGLYTFEDLKRKWEVIESEDEMHRTLFEIVGEESKSNPLPARQQFRIDETQPDRAGYYLYRRGWVGDETVTDCLFYSHSESTYERFLHGYREVLPGLVHGPPDGNCNSTHEQALTYWRKLWQGFFHIVYGQPIQFRRRGSIASKVLFLANLHNLATYCQSDAVCQVVRSCVQDLPGVWKFVAKEPAFMACFGAKLGSTEIFDDAVRHIAGKSLFTGTFSLDLESDRHYEDHELFRDAVEPEVAYAKRRMSSTFEDRFFLLLRFLSEVVDGDVPRYVEAAKCISTFVLGISGGVEKTDWSQRSLPSWNLARLFALCRLVTDADTEEMAQAFNLPEMSEEFMAVRSVLGKKEVSALLRGFIKPVSTRECRDWLDQEYYELDTCKHHRPCAECMHIDWPCEDSVHYAKYRIREYSTYDGCWRRTQPASDDANLLIEQSNLVEAGSEELVSLNITASDSATELCAKRCCLDTLKMSECFKGDRTDTFDTEGLGDCIQNLFEEPFDLAIEGTALERKRSERRVSTSIAVGLLATLMIVTLVSRMSGRIYGRQV